MKGSKVKRSGRTLRERLGIRYCFWWDKWGDCVLFWGGVLLLWVIGSCLVIGCDIASHPYYK